MGKIGRTNTGGGSLNLTIYPSVEQPASPVDNMVWFNTEVSIPHWYFQNTAPSNPEVGDVYVTITTTASNVLQILRNNGMELYFGTPRQWDGTNWNIIGGKIYHHGSWHNLQTFVYDGTIGNAEMNFNHNVGGYPWKTSASNSGTTITANSDHFRCYYNGGGNGLCYSGNKIDFSAVNSVKIVYTGGSAGFVSAKKVYIFTSASSGSASGAVVSSDLSGPSAKTTITLDTSSLNGEYYLGFHFSSSSSSSVNNHYEIYSIELIG